VDQGRSFPSPLAGGIAEYRSGVASEALTSPALLSQRERRENSMSLSLVPLSPFGREGLGE